MVILGKQFIITLEQCSPDYIDDPDRIIETVTAASIEANLHILKSMDYRFEPYGLTFMLLLSQSHLLVHTWPEYNTMIVDVFVCTLDFDIDTFIEKLCSITGAARAEKETVVFEQKNPVHRFQQE